MPVRLGINPIGWTNDDMPELGDDTPLEVCLEEARAAGYDGIELGRKFPRTAGALRPLLARHGLSLVSGWYGASLQTRSAREEIEAMQPDIELLEAMGCSVIVFAEVGRSVHAQREVPRSRRPTLGHDDWARFGERLMEVAGEPVGLLLDTGHLTYAGGNLLRIARRHARRLAHVHCKDVRPGALAEVHRSDLSFLEAVLAGVFTVPGDGVIDWGALLPILKSVGYSGWLAVVEAEQDPAVADPATYGRLGFTNLSRAAAAAGL